MSGKKSTLLPSLLTVIALGIPSILSELVTRQNTTNPNAALPGWAFVGCFTDNNAASRTLQQTTLVNRNMTQASCTSFCASSFHPTNFAGMEFSDECYCDYDIQGTATKVNDLLCNFPCGGDDTLTCGGANLISIFHNTKSAAPDPQNIPQPLTVAPNSTWIFDGCFTDAVGSNPRTLERRLQVAGGVDIFSCLVQCNNSGFNISGLEFGQECWCGNSFSVPAADITAPLSDCSKACLADPTELCGAANRLAVYTKNSTPATSTIVQATSTATAITLVPNTTVAPATTITAMNTIPSTTAPTPPLIRF